MEHGSGLWLLLVLHILSLFFLLSCVLFVTFLGAPDSPANAVRVAAKRNLLDLGAVFRSSEALGNAGLCFLSKGSFELGLGL